MRSILATSVILSSLLAHPAAFAAEASNSHSIRGTFLLTSATDTVSVERFERTATRLSGELLFKLADQRWTYEFDLDPGDGHVRHMRTEFRRASAGVDSPPAHSGTLEFVGDSVFARTASGDRKSVV